jgi:hypothetical protein
MTTPAATPATALSVEQLAALVQQARAIPFATGSIVDPVRLRHLQGWWSHELTEWAEAVLGRAIPHVWRLSWFELVVLDLAHDAEPSPPPPPKLTAQRAIRQAADDVRHRKDAAAARAVRDEWLALATALPVKVAVAYNYSGPLHFESYQSGAVHIILREPLRIGRLYRGAHQALCETPSRAKHLLFAHDHDDPADRCPTCQACLRTAYRITGRTRSPLLLRSA